MNESETHFLLDVEYNAYKFFLSEVYFLASHIYPFLLKDYEDCTLVYEYPFSYKNDLISNMAQQ